MKFPHVGKWGIQQPQKITQFLIVCRSCFKYLLNTISAIGMNDDDNNFFTYKFQTFHDPFRFLTSMSKTSFLLTFICLQIFYWNNFRHSNRLSVDNNNDDKDTVDICKALWWPPSLRLRYHQLTWHAIAKLF